MSGNVTRQCNGVPGPLPVLAFRNGTLMARCVRAPAQEWRVPFGARPPPDRRFYIFARVIGAAGMARAFCPAPGANGRCPGWRRTIEPARWCRPARECCLLATFALFGLPYDGPLSPVLMDSEKAPFGFRLGLSRGLLVWSAEAGLLSPCPAVRLWRNSPCSRSLFCLVLPRKKLR